MSHLSFRLSSCMFHLLYYFNVLDRNGIGVRYGLLKEFNFVSHRSYITISLHGFHIENTECFQNQPVIQQVVL
jgi:hypothetical protein